MPKERKKGREDRREGGKKEGERERGPWEQAEVHRQPGLTYTLTWDQFKKVYTLKKKKKEKRQTLHICACSVASVMSDSWRPYGPQSTRLLCPWDSPGKNTGVGCQVLLQGILLQGIFPTQGSNLCLFVSPALLSRFFTTSATWEALPTSRRIVFELQKTQC